MQTIYQSSSFGGLDWLYAFGYMQGYDEKKCIEDLDPIVWKPEYLMGVADGQGDRVDDRD